MTSPQDQIFEAYLPVYDAVPEQWEDARQFIVEQLKRISNTVNLREIGWFLDEELVSGKQFIPGIANSQEYRTVFRKVIDMGAISAGANTALHGITFDANFSLIDLWVSATDSATSAATYVAPEVNMDTTNVNFNSPQAYTRGFAFIEYIQEL